MKSTKTKPAKRKLNVRLLRRVKRHILAEPKRLMMEWWRSKLPQELNGPPCGTVACIAGWTVQLAMKKPEAVSASKIGTHARKLLGLTEIGCRHLFGVAFWPDSFRKRYHYEGGFGMDVGQLSLKHRRENAAIVAERIEHFITTGE